MDLSTINKLTMVLFSDKQIDKLARRYPLHSQDDKGLDTFVRYTLYQPDRRNNGDGFWYIVACERIGNEVQFVGIHGSAARPQSAELRPFLQSILARWTERSGQVIEVDTDFKPGTLQELYDTEPWLQSYIDRLREEQRRRDILASRDNVTDTICQHFAGLDDDGAMARKIAEQLADSTVNEMVNHRLDVKAATLRALAMRLGIVKLNINTV